jgi:hypothetical protein
LFSCPRLPRPPLDYLVSLLYRIPHTLLSLVSYPRDFTPAYSLAFTRFLTLFTRTTTTCSHHYNIQRVSFVITPAHWSLHSHILKVILALPFVPMPSHAPKHTPSRPPVGSSVSDDDSDIGTSPVLRGELVGHAFPITALLPLPTAGFVSAAQVPTHYLSMIIPSPPFYSQFHTAFPSTYPLASPVRSCPVSSLLLSVGWDITALARWCAVGCITNAPCSPSTCPRTPTEAVVIMYIACSFETVPNHK